MPSVTLCRIKRQRPAPSAARTATSRVRARARLGQNQTGDVGAHDEQHEHARHQRRRQRGRDHRGHEIVPQARDVGTPSFVALGILPGQARGDVLELTRGGLDAGSRVEARDHVDGAVTAITSIDVHAERCPDVRPFGKLEAWFHDPHDLVGPSVEPDRATDDRSIEVESPLPQLMRDQRDGCRLGRLVFVLTEAPADHRPFAQERKQRGGDAGAVDANRLLVVAEIELVAREDPEALETLHLVHPVAQVARRDVDRQPAQSRL